MSYDFDKYNLHTHSFYCGHGNGNLVDYVKEAKTNNFELLGFSEHCPVKENRWQNSRMNYETLDTYLDDIDRTKEKYDGDIKILSGFECDYFKEYHQYYSELKERCDYLLFGVHYLNLPSDKDSQVHYHQLNNKSLNVYTNQYVKSLESGLFSFGAHPDLFFIQYFKWDNQAKAVSKEIIEAAIYYDVALEINGYGMLKERVKGFHDDIRYPYPVKEFWELAKSYDKLKIVGNADAHDPKNILRAKVRCKKFAKDLDVKYWDADITRIKELHKIEFING